MSPKIKGTKIAELPKTYRELCALLLPRKIHADSELEAAQEIMDVLTVLPAWTPDQSDYLETLAELVEAYEEQTVKFSKRSGLETLRFLLAKTSSPPAISLESSAPTLVPATASSMENATSPPRTSGSLPDTSTSARKFFCE